MKKDARKYSTEEQHLIRKLAVQRVQDGERVSSVTRSFGLGDNTIYRWLNMFKNGGFEALSPKARTGRHRKLSSLEENEVKRWVVGGDPRQYGFESGLWTRQVVGELIWDRFGVELSTTSVSNLLYRLGVTPHRPLRRTYERDDQQIQAWISKTYPAIQRSAKRHGAEIFWLDTATIQSDDLRMRTWSMEGKRPAVSNSGQHQSINAISALSNKGGFWYNVFSEKFNGEVFIEYLCDLLENRQKPVYLIVDGHPLRKSKEVQQFLETMKGRIELFRLPPYATDLNPECDQLSASALTGNLRNHRRLRNRQ